MNNYFQRAGVVRSAKRMIWKLVCATFVCASMAGYAVADQDRFPRLRVDKKPNEKTGPALVTIEGKNKLLARRAVQAWPIMDGENALVIVTAPKKPSGIEYRLRFYEGDSRKYRDLGKMNFPATGFSQAKQSDGSWVFVFTGIYLDKPTIVIAGMNSIHGELRNASEPKLHEDSITFLDANGNAKTLPVAPLIAADMTKIYEIPPPDHEKLRYAQFLRNGLAVLLAADGSFRNEVWRTNGEAIIVTVKDGKEMRWPRESLVPVSGVPAAARLNVRLLQPLSSEKTKEGDRVEAVLISTGTFDNKTLLPQGTVFSGSVVDVRKLGWGMRHETAGLTLEFTSARLPDGTELAMHTRLDRVENSRENVNDGGMIKGIRSTGTPGYSAERKIGSIATIDPISYLFTSVASVGVLGFADPEIRYPAGTEVLVRFEAPLVTAKEYERTVPEFEHSEADKIERLVKQLPFRTATKGSNKSSDLTNLVFIGSPDALKRAFAAAGWVQVDELNAASKFMTIKTVGGNQVYNEAPMSTLLLDERPPVFTLSKTTNSFASRHHLRAFDPAMNYEGQTVLTASSTQDIRVAFSYKQKTFIHVIDEYIDNERAKIVNDLEFTGCVEAMNLVPRSWVPHDAYNATGDRLHTDGAVAVMRISECQHPRTTPNTTLEGTGRFKRSTRNTFLYIRDDLYRGNLIYTGVGGARWLKRFLSTKNEIKPETGTWRTTDQTGTVFKGLGDAPRPQEAHTGRIDREFRTDATFQADAALQEQSRALEEAHRWDPPHYEIGIFGGYMRYPNTRNEVVVLLVVPDTGVVDPNNTFAATLVDQFENGGVAGISVTLNSWKWFSNQFAFSYTRSTWDFAQILILPTQETTFENVPLATRQFEYNLMFNLRPPKSRWRPYIAAGPAVVLTNLTDSPIKKAAGPFKLGLQNVGLLLAAYNFGTKAPLDGGGVFSIGMVYGAGIKFRVHPRITINFDFRETWSRAPKFLSDSYTRDYFEDQDFAPQVFQVSTEDKYRQDRLTAGISFTF